MFLAATLAPTMLPGVPKLHTDTDEHGTLRRQRPVLSSESDVRRNTGLRCFFGNLISFFGKMFSFFGNMIGRRAGVARRKASDPGCLRNDKEKDFSGEDIYI